MSADAPKSKKKKLLVTLVIIIVAIIALAAIGIVSLGTAVKVGGEQAVQMLTKGETTIGGAYINPFTGHVLIKDILIKNPKTDANGQETKFTNEDFFKLERFEVEVSLASLLSDEIHVSKVHVFGPEVTYEKTPLSDSNLNVILENVNKMVPPSDKKPEEEKKEEPKEEGKAKTYVIDSLIIKDVNVKVSSMGVTAPLVIPAINVEKLGKPGEGVTIAQAIQASIFSMFTGIFDGIKNMGASVLNAGKDAGDALKNAAGNAGEALKDAGKGLKDAGKGIVNGLFGK